MGSSIYYVRHVMTDMFREEKCRWLHWAVYCIYSRLWDVWEDDNIQNLYEETLYGIFVF
jgi:hypothetical protein